jgi:hypothetical protein
MSRSISSKTGEQRDALQGVATINFVEAGINETKAIWQHYRRFRRGVIALEALEAQLGATMLQLSEDSTARKPSLVEVVFLTQSLRALRETSEQTLSSIIAIENGTLAGLLDDGKAFVGALEQRIPELYEETRAGLMLFVQRYGSPRQWLRLVRGILSAKQKFYRSAVLAVQQNGTASRVSLGRHLEDMALRHQATLPEFPPSVGRPEARTSPEELAELIEQAIKRGRDRLNNGAPGFVAGASYNNLANQVAWHDPEQAASFGIFVPPTKPQPSIACLFPSGPSIAFCIVVVLIAMSSHNLEPNDVPSGGGDGGGEGTTGDDDGPWGGDGDQDPPEEG